ncbi:O-antigen ligase family protein [Mesorhizobium sp. YR577]|uniref:O-antigen ligase family protein n=1 Tax=Mesorhizobium sp. YR577 TaxID=1884373 RepID=UPI0008E578C5|nr:O-antigen ligase family protein [Mesorhizobium sp. YR577]SFT95808.1 O-antigen ligase [Mesorhizobium sp. YR577]
MFSKDLLNYRSVNKLFTFLCFATPPAAGSAVSFIWHGGALWCLFEIVTGRRKFSRDRAMWVMAIVLFAYCLVITVSTLWNSETFGDTRHLLRLATLLLFPFSYSLWSISNKVDVARTTVLASMVACYAGLVVAAFQYYYLGERAWGGAGNPIVFATVIGLTGAVSLAGIFFLQEKKLTLPLAGAFAASWIGLIFSGSRALWISSFVVTVAILWIYRRTLSRYISPRNAVIIVAIFVAIAAAGAPTVMDRMGRVAADWDKLTVNSQQETSLGVRLSLWEMALDLVQQRPFIGYGMGSTRKLITTGLRDQYGLDFTFTHFHNGFATVTVEAGLIGLLTLLAIFAAATATAVRCFRDSRDEVERFGATVLVILVVTYMISGLTNIILGHDILDTMMVVFLITGTYLAAGTSMVQASDPIAARKPA